MTDSSGQKKGTGKTAAITGATSGMGKTFAYQLAAQGYNLFLAARRTALLDELKTELEKQYKISVEIMSADLADSEQLLKVEKRLTELETLEYLINNAGFGGNGTFPDVDIDFEEKMIRVHCIATVRLSQAALIPMVRKKSGNIINLASVAGFRFGRGMADYTATKAFLVNFSKSFQCDVNQYGIKVQALCPGLVRTGFHSTEEMKDSMIPQTIPEFFWLKSDDVVRKSLRSIQRNGKLRRVVCIPSLRYKLIAGLACSFCLAPFRILFSGGKIR